MHAASMQTLMDMNKRVAIILVFMVLGIALKAQEGDSIKKFVDYAFEPCAEAEAMNYVIMATTPNEAGVYPARVYTMDGSLSRTGTVDGPNTLQRTGLWTSWRASGKVYATLQYAQGKRNGTTEYFFENGQKSAQVTYVDNNKTDEAYWEADGTPQPDTEQANQRAKFAGGKQAMNEFIRNNLKMPKSFKRGKGAKRERVIVWFVVDKDGQLTEIETPNNPTPELGEEARRVVAAMPRWLPAKHMNIPRPMRMRLPIEFIKR